MNDHQLYTAATPAERTELLLLMLAQLERRQRRVILAGLRLRRERRRTRIAHYIGDRRLRPNRSIYRWLWIYILTTLSIATWLIAAHVQPMYGAPLLAGYNLFLLAILLIKPYQRQTQPLKANR